RGTGETLACGSGACAAAVACALLGLTERAVDVALTGGVLHIRWDETSNHVTMSGPAEEIFTGEIDI
ncbi:MAG: diaminopimelate epimerase, partial [Myxococcota bacterium]